MDIGWIDDPDLWQLREKYKEAAFEGTLSGVLGRMRSSQQRVRNPGYKVIAKPGWLKAAT